MGALSGTFTSMPPKLDLTGQRFTRLLVLGFAEKRNKQTMWRCVCDCGTEKLVSGCNLKSNHTKSCGCLLAEGLWRKGHPTHNKGLSHDYSEPPTSLHPVIHILRRKRYMLRITQAQLASRMGWDKRTLSQAELGKNAQTFQFVNDWANALGLDLTLRPKELK